VAAGGGLVFAAVRALQAWRALGALRRGLRAALADVTTSVAGIDTRVAAIGSRTAELERAQARLQHSLAEASVLAGALGAARALVARATGFIPR
jgi:hypothetical protein